MIVSAFYPLTVSAQDYRRWHLPEGAKFRLGKGSIIFGGQQVAQFSPDGTRLAVASSIGIWLYETQIYQEVALFTGPNNWVDNVSFSPDGRTLASGSKGKVDLWDVSTGAHRETLIDHRVAYVNLSFSPDGRMLASGGIDGTILLWDLSHTNATEKISEDVNSDGVVNVQDLVIVASNFGQTGQNTADVNSDGVVNILDLILVAGAL